MSQRGDVRCGHCGARRPNLHAFKERYLDEGKVLVVRCLLCGWRVIDVDVSGYRVLGWSSPWPRREEEWLELNWSRSWGVG